MRARTCAARLETADLRADAMLVLLVKPRTSAAKGLANIQYKKDAYGRCALPGLM